MEFVVGSHRNETPPGTTQGVEDLRGSISPHLQEQTHRPTEVVKRKKKRISILSFSTHLHDDVHTDLCVKNLLPLWSQVVLDAIYGSVQGDATDEQDRQNNIWECCCEVHHLDTQR